MGGDARRPAIFLDRDGTLIDEVDYLVRPEELRLIPGAAEALVELARAGYALVLVTNQSAVARGMLSEEGLEEIHARLARELAERGARLDAVYVCPHHPSEGVGAHRRECDCRKPAPGLLVRAARERALDLERSWIVGDSERDLAAGAAVGVRGVLVETGKGRAELEGMRREGREPEWVAEDLGAAARIVIGG